MSVRNLDKLFAPRRVAVVGAGGERTSVGQVVLRNLVDSGFEGVVYPVNPKREAVGGVQAYPSVTETPAVADLAVICTPAATVSGVVRECGEAGVPAVAILSAGFREAGEGGAALEREVAAEAARFGIRVMGPNCLGLIVPRIGLNASFSPVTPPDGQVAFVTQSGALATSVIDWAAAEGIGFSHVISLGNMLDVDLGDLVDYIGQDERTRSLVLYVESVTDARKFMSAARAFALRKPIVAYKGGRFPASAQAAVSHTGAIAGEDAVYDAAFERAGVVRVGRIADVFATAELLARHHAPSGARLGIVTNAGGPGVMAADALLSRGGALAALSDESRSALGELLPPSAATANPVDVLGDADPDRYRAAVETVLDDPEVDAVLVILTPQAMTDPTRAARAVADAGAKSSKPLLAAWMGGPTVAEGMNILATAGAATYEYPEQAVDAFMHLVSYSRNLATLYETPRAIPVSFDLDRSRVKELLEPVLSEADEVLSETASKTLLDAYGIATTKPVAAASAADAVAVAAEIGYPVVLKVRSPEITHKTDVGGVVAGISTPEEVGATYERILATVAERQPDARIQGVTVQPMADAPGYELLLGARRDPTFGAVIALGAGGITAELQADLALGLPPLNERLARRMVESLRISPLLGGYRGRPAVDLDALLETMIRFSYLVADYPEVSEIEINPLLASSSGAIALDARAVVDQGRVGRRPAPFSHLAIRPYPEQYTTEVVTEGGLAATLRPIKPEDEPRWHEMLDACSLDSIRQRFRALVKHTHEMATRYCFIDYDRELAIVAEVGDEDARKLAGVGRLAADPDHRRAEYAVLVADPWQGRGLSDALTAHCLAVARDWGVESVYAETTPENRRMIAVLESHGFEVESRPAEGIVVGERAASS
ncbi:MAG TPA: bifunctional acetate--CoA ligase family protein/GNAT family N-acetyltransferase [Solirubrobacterales bacterium]|nr:bifunctional acetate--CoA ligase family protein/GNAT family N-acetyltransferase [Solirubrobacterales bacterium]